MCRRHPHCLVVLLVTESSERLSVSSTLRCRIYGIFAYSETAKVFSVWGQCLLYSM